MLDAMNDQWDALVAASLDKGRKLRQASSQVAHNKTLEDAKSKLDELTTEMNQSDVGNDLRSCREKLKKQQMLENDVASLDQKINDLVMAGEEMAQDGHFDAESILKQGQKYKKRLGEFKGVYNNLLSPSVLYCCQGSVTFFFNHNRSVEEASRETGRVASFPYLQL